MVSESPQMISATDAAELLRSLGLIVHPATRTTWYIGIPPLDPANCRLLAESTLCWIAAIIAHADQMRPPLAADDPPRRSQRRRRWGR